MACETALKGPFNRVAACGQKLLDGLTSILFYSVFGYFAAKLKEIYYSERLRLERSTNRTDTVYALFRVGILQMKGKGTKLGVEKKKAFQTFKSN